MSEGTDVGPVGRIGHGELPNLPAPGVEGLLGRSVSTVPSSMVEVRDSPLAVNGKGNGQK